MAAKTAPAKGTSTRTTSRTTYAKSVQTIDGILAAARGLFLARNYADVTMSDIARAAEVTKGALYHHFSSKEELYVEMMLRTLGEVRAVQEAAAEGRGGGCRARLRRSVLAFLGLPETTRQALALVRRDVNIFSGPTRDKLVRAYQSAVPEQVEGIIRDGVRAGEVRPWDARLLSWQHVAAVEVALRPYADGLFSSDEEKADFVVSLFFDGVGTPTPQEAAWHAA